MFLLYILLLQLRFHLKKKKKRSAVERTSLKTTAQHINRCAKIMCFVSGSSAYFCKLKINKLETEIFLSVRRKGKIL